jgi:hypothetical protein
VVHGGDASIGTANFAAGQAQAFKGLRRGDFVEQLQVDVEERWLACGLDDYVLFPDFFE